MCVYCTCTYILYTYNVYILYMYFSTFWLSVSLIDPLLAAGGMLLVAFGLTNTNTAMIPTNTKRIKTINKETTIPAIAPLDKPVKPVSITSYYTIILYYCQQELVQLLSVYPQDH